MKIDKLEQGEVLVGLNSNLSENFIQKYHLQSYKKKSPDEDLGDFLYLPNGKPGCFCVSKDFFAISESFTFVDGFGRDFRCRDFKCKVAVSFYSNSMERYFETVIVTAFLWSELKEREKEIRMACSFANSFVRRAAPIMKEGNADRLREFAKRMRQEIHHF